MMKKDMIGTQCLPDVGTCFDNAPTAFRNPCFARLLLLNHKRLPRTPMEVINDISRRLFNGITDATMTTLVKDLRNGLVDIITIAHQPSITGVNTENFLKQTLTS